MEVLVALALASVVLSSLMSGFSRHMRRVADLEHRYRNLVIVSSMLEKSMASRISGDLTDTFEGTECKVTVRSVPSDPRIDSIKCVIDGSGPGQNAFCAAYRLRISSGSENSEQKKQD